MQFMKARMMSKATKPVKLRDMAGRIISAFQPERWWEALTPFEVLVSTVLSQKTERRGTKRAFMRLKNELGIEPRILAAADEVIIAELIKPAGLYRSKSVKIKAIASAVEELYGGDLAVVLGLPEVEARRTLMELPGIGPKTADVAISFLADRPVIAIDVHIFRIAERWGAVGKGATYEEVRAALESAVDPENRVAAHLALIEFGREVCTARKPKCEICPVNDLC